MIDQVKIQISQMSINDAYTLYKILCDPQSEQASEVRYGYRIKFDLDSLLNKTIHMKLMTKRNKIRIGHKLYKIEDFNTEINTREINIKKLLLENASAISLTSPRIPEANW